MDEWCENRLHSILKAAHPLVVALRTHIHGAKAHHFNFIANALEHPSFIFPPKSMNECLVLETTISNHPLCNNMLLTLTLTAKYTF